MVARVSTIQGSPDRVDEAVRFLGASTSKGLEEMKGSFLLVDRKSGKMVAVTLWETEEALRASASAADQVRGEISERAAAAPAIVETYEVAVQDWG